MPATVSCGAVVALRLGAQAAERQRSAARLRHGREAVDPRGYELRTMGAVCAEVDEQDPGLGRARRVGAEDEVAEAPGDDSAAAPLERLQHVRVRAEDDGGAGSERSVGEAPL